MVMTFLLHSPAGIGDLHGFTGADPGFSVTRRPGLEFPEFQHPTSQPTV
jgi:hypothetical protein